MIKMSTEEIEKLMKERLVRGTQFPPWFDFKEPGTTMLGKVISFRTHPVNAKARVAVVRTLDGKEYSISLLTVLERLFTELSINQNDYVYIVFEGVGKTKAGRKTKIFSIAKMSEEEINKILQKTPEKIEKIEKQSETTPPQPPPSPIPPPPQPPSPIIPPDKAQEIREFFERLFEFYEEGLTEEQLKERISKRFPDVKFEDVLKVCDFIILDEISKRFKKRQ